MALILQQMDGELSLLRSYTKPPEDPSLKMVWTHDNLELDQRNYSNSNIATEADSPEQGEQVPPIPMSQYCQCDLVKLLTSLSLNVSAL